MKRIKVKLNQRNWLTALCLIFSIPLIQISVFASNNQPSEVVPSLKEKLTVTNNLNGDLNDEISSVKLHIPCDKGDYLTGYIETTSNNISIDIIAPSGKVLRRLIDTKKGIKKFYTVAENCQETWLLSGSGTYKIILKDKVSLKDQVPTKPKSLLSPKVSALLAELKQEKNTNRFWFKIEKSGTPLVEETSAGTVMTFLVRGNYNNVKLLGGPSNNHESLQRLANSDTWYKSFIVPDDSQLSYQIAPNVPQPPFEGFARRIAIKAVLQADPYNKYPWPKSATSKYAQYSTVNLNKAKKKDEFVNKVTDKEVSTKGTLSTFSFTSNTLNNTRDITIYRPQINGKNKTPPVLLYIFDAKRYIELVGVPQILDNLIAQGKIPPTIAVFISNPDGNARARELPANPTFADVLANDLVPKVNKKLDMVIPAERTIIAGSSYGGLAATTIALRHPQIFGNVISMSGSYWWYPREIGKTNQHYVASQVIEMRKKPIRFFLSAGLFEYSRDIGDGILETNRHLRDVLLAKGYDTYHKEYSSGHDYYAWQSILSDGLITLFAKD